MNGGVAPHGSPHSGSSTTVRSAVPPQHNQGQPIFASDVQADDMSQCGRSRSEVDPSVTSLDVSVTAAFPMTPSATVSNRSRSVVRTHPYAAHPQWQCSTTSAEGVTLVQLFKRMLALDLPHVPTVDKDTEYDQTTIIQ